MKGTLKLITIFFTFTCVSAQVLPQLTCDQSTLTPNVIFYPNSTSNYTVTSVFMDCMYLCGPNTVVYDTSNLTTSRCRVGLINAGSKLISSSPSCSFYDAIFVRNNGTLTINANANGAGFKVFYEPLAVINDLTGNATTFSCSSIQFPNVICSGAGFEELRVLQDDFLLYPVPANDELKIQFNSNAAINFNYLIIYDGFGRAIKENEIKFTQRSLNIKTDDLPNGIYFLCLRSQKRISISRCFIIEK